MFGVSGGPDSICLLDILYDIALSREIEFDIVVAHVNHMIRAEASSDEEFVKEYCLKRNLKFVSKHVDVLNIAASKRIGTEEAGRYERYIFFDEVLKEYEATKIATAHTKCDNAETVLMNIIRGTGMSGLKGISAKRDRVFIKPLIYASRNEIEEYCEIYNLNPRYDKTNDENVYTRNKVRNILLPLIRDEFNPNIIETLDRLSRIAAIDNEFFESEIEETFKEVLIKEEKEEIILELKGFNEKHVSIKSRLILFTIKRLLGDSNGIGLVHVNDIIKLCENNIGNKYLTPNKYIKIAVNKGKMYFFVTKKS